MAGSIPLSLQQIFDDEGNLLSGGLVYFIQAGTVGTPQNAFQDTPLTLAWPNPYVLLENARLPLVYFADGYIKVRITDSVGNQIFNQDNIPVTGFSSGGGGGGTIDATSIMSTGDMKLVYNTGVLTGFVRANGRTIGNATSGATERANADTAALFAFLYNADANLAVSGGRGVSAVADYAANKTIALPDCRGRGIFGLDDMGNSAAGRLTSTYFGTSAIVLGAAGGSESTTLTAAQIPSITSANASQSITVASTSPTGATKLPNQATSFGAGATGVAYNDGNATAAISSTGVNSISVTSNNTSGNAHRTASPAILMTVYVKL